MKIKLLAVVANEDELSPCLFQVSRSFRIYGMTVCNVYIGNVDLIVAYVGTGMSIARRQLEKLIAICSPVMVINLGIAGSCRHNIGSIIVASKAYVLTENPTIDVTISKFDNLILNFIDVIKIPKLKDSITVGNIASSEFFVNKKEEASAVEVWDCIDMEAAAIYDTCVAHTIDCYFIKYVTDNASTSAKFQVQNNIGKAQNILVELLYSFVSFLNERDILEREI